jgi:[ribosomal protein S5]-alanine N-acetyltransferase
MLSPTIQTKNHLLRPFKQEDAVLWQTWDTDPEIQMHMPEPINEPQDIEEQYSYITECNQDKEGYYWSIETNGTTIGTISLTEINSHHKVAELGILIGNKNYWSKGVASEVIPELITYAFRNLDIDYINATVEELNIPMQKVFEKNGFKKDGQFENARIKNGKRINVIHYSTSKK